MRTTTVARFTLAILVALVMVLAAPLHAAHSHGHDDGHLHDSCAVCKSQSPASEPLTRAFTGVLLAPVGLLSLAAVHVPLATRPASIASRAPPTLLA